MIRPILTELVLVLAPFVLYAIWIAWRGRDPRQRLSWADAPWIGLLAAAVALTLGSLAVVRALDSAPAGSRYVPARLENGHVVPPSLQVPSP